MPQLEARWAEHFRLWTDRRPKWKHMSSMLKTTSFSRQIQTFPLKLATTIQTLPKKDNLKDLNNWRKVNVMMIPSKLLAKNNNNCAASYSGSRWKAQEWRGGIPSGDRCIDQLFALHIIEQCTEWQRQAEICWTLERPLITDIVMDSGPS